MEVYFDNSATTRVLEKVKDIVVETMVKDYGNPSSLHGKGIEAENYVKNSKEIISKIMKVTPKEIYFTSGGTESNNLAIIGTAMANKRSGNHIITSMIEHPSVSNTVNYLEENGFRITRLPVDENGVILLEELENAICEDTILVSIMYVNNEIGSLQPIEEIAKIIKDKKPDILFHVDAVQAFGKYQIFPKRQGIDLLSVSGHKIHGPKGIGFIYIKDKVKVRPILYGGEQQKGVRSGTENVSGIAGIGIACQEAYKTLNESVNNLNNLKDYFIDKVEVLDDVILNSQKGVLGAPHIVSVSFRGIRSEVLLHALEERGVYVSSGSACASNKPAVSATLKAIKLNQELLDCTLRFSFSIYSTIEEINYCIEQLNDLLYKLRLYARH